MEVLRDMWQLELDIVCRLIPRYATIYAEVAVDIQPHFCFQGRPCGLFCGWLPDASVSTAVYSPRSKPNPPRLFLTPRYTQGQASNSSISSFEYPSKYLGTNIMHYSTK
jgi:hypothetical protein